MKNQSLGKVKPYFRIAGALQNMYGKKLISDVGKEDNIINKMISDLEKPNNLYTYLTENSLLRRKVYEYFRKSDFRFSTTF